MSLIQYRDELTLSEKEQYNKILNAYIDYLKTPNGKDKLWKGKSATAISEYIENYFAIKYEQLDYNDIDPVLPIIKVLGGKSGMIRAYDIIAKQRGVMYDLQSGERTWAEIEKEYIAFSPAQIKSATANVGTFSSNDADIRYKIAGYHGSGASFDRFDHTYMGTGEGAQAFGWLQLDTKHMLYILAP